MKRIILFSTALVFFVASQASAAVVVNDDVKMTTGINSGAQSGSGGGGPFLAQIYADAPNTTVDTTPAAGPIAEVLTADALSECFGLPLVLERHGDRWTARAAGGEA